MKCYAIYDKKAKSHVLIYSASSDAIASRMILSFAAPGSDLFDYAEDFELYSLCDFDNDTGEVGPSHRVYIINVSDVISNYQQQFADNEAKEIS
jgi:hypothetical protein